MTLVERINHLQLRAVAADDEETIKTRSGEFTTITEKLAKATGSAKRVAGARAELRSAGVEQDDIRQLRDSALAVVTELINTVEALPVDAKLDAVKVQANVVERILRDSQSWAVETWKSQLPAELPTVDRDLLDALEHGGVDVEAIRSDIERAESTLLVLRNRDLPEPGDYQKLKDALQILSSSSERIGRLVDPAIADVVLRAQADGVAVAELTTDVVAELQRLGILDRFRVVLR